SHFFLSVYKLERIQIWLYGLTSLKRTKPLILRGPALYADFPLPDWRDITSGGAPLVAAG
ncbi:MAG: hypothetical protein WB696_10150, partial [Chthoniobacterales bacterium]